MKAYLQSAVCALVLGIGMATSASAQLLDIEINNGVFYVYDTADRSGFAASPAVVPPWSGGPSPLNFFEGMFIADIVSVNGQPARGVMVRRGTRVGLTTNQVPGQAIADTTRGFIDDGVWEIQSAEGTAIGTFTTHGFIGGSPPPGAPAAATNTNLAVTGGTGVFFGVGGQLTGAPVTGFPGTRVQASVTEDPANRRINGGNRSRFLVQLLPAYRPEIVVGPAGRAVFHTADGRPVTTRHPAAAGEALTLYARSLGPELPSAAGQLAAGPLSVVIDGRAAEVKSAAVDPHGSDTYRIDFVVPDDVASPIAALYLSSAWVSSSPVQFAVR